MSDLITVAILTKLEHVVNDVCQLFLLSIKLKAVAKQDMAVPCWISDDFVSKIISRQYGESY